MSHFLKSSLLLIIFTLAASLPGNKQAWGATSIPRDYTATYRVLRNDNHMAEVTVKLSHQDGGSTLHGFIHDTRGLADFLNVKGFQTVTGKWQDGVFFPDHYHFKFSVIGFKSVWKANFDWSAGTVTATRKKRDTLLPLTDGANDPFSLSLNIGSHLAKNQDVMSVNVVEEDKIEQQRYQVDNQELLNTSLGCIDTTRVKRIRDNTKRTSLFWYANDHDFVPVQIRHSKKKGNDFTLEIISLNVAGQEIRPTGAC